MLQVSSDSDTNNRKKKSSHVKARRSLALIFSRKMASVPVTNNIPNNIPSTPWPNSEKEYQLIQVIGKFTYNILLFYISAFYLMSYNFKMGSSVTRDHVRD